MRASTTRTQPDRVRLATDTYAYEKPADWSEDFYVTDVRWTEAQRITTTDGNDHWPPAGSSDGRTLVYSSDGMEAVQGDLMAINLETRTVTQLNDDVANDMMADWKH